MSYAATVRNLVKIRILNFFAYSPEMRSMRRSLHMMGNFHKHCDWPLFRALFEVYRCWKPLISLARALMGLWIFHHLLGGLKTPPSISAPTHCGAKQKTAFEISLKIIPKLLVILQLRSKLRSPEVKRSFFDQNSFSTIAALF